ncbi:MAG: SGNH/GDSL hydrolase family protein [Endomicrobiales bacterium]|nr:SGNH/GDSL hydrolase family protein [Endomicrobiales bacterium]
MRDLTRNILLSAAGILAAILLAELILAFFIPKHLFHTVEIASNHGFYRLSENPKLIYVPIPGSGFFNSYGHRGKDHSFEKASEKRIVFIGDSVAEGLGSQVGARFTDIIENLAGQKAEIINLGVCGYSFLQELEYLKYIGVRFSPDLIIWSLTFNDLLLHSAEMCRFQDKISAIDNNSFYHDYFFKYKSAFRNTVRKSNIWKYFRYALAKHSRIDFYASSNYMLKPEETEKLLKELKAIAAKRSFEILFVYLPVNTEEYAAQNETFKKQIAKEGFQLYDIDASLKRYPGRKTLFIGDPCHLSASGNTVVANLIYENLIENRLAK